MENRKIGLADWVHMRKWHILCLLAGMAFLGEAIAMTSPLNWFGVCFFGVPAIVVLSFTLICMARDKELNEKNGVKRFWFNF